MVTPSVFDGQQYYKIGDWVHLAWNYTSIRAFPNAVDILATCTANQATYTLAVNQSVAKVTGPDATATGEVFWNTGSYKEDHPNGAELLTEMYTLIIYDSNSSATEPAKPGYLAPFKQFTFGMYSKQAYKDYDSKLPADLSQVFTNFNQRGTSAQTAAAPFLHLSN
jgi:hypothetical protein